MNPVRQALTRAVADAIASGAPVYRNRPALPYLHFDSKYAPCGFLIVRGGADPYSSDPADSVLIQSDWDYPGVASRTGFVPCECGATDGTVDCPHHSASDMIGAAYDWLAARDGMGFADLGDYLPEPTDPPVNLLAAMQERGVR